MNPSIDCLDRGHFWACASREGKLCLRLPGKPGPGYRVVPMPEPDQEEEQETAAAWCLWCGSGVIDSDLADPATGAALPWFDEQVRKEAGNR